MSAGPLARNRSLSIGSGHSSGSSKPNIPAMDVGTYFQPCAATASMFLYAQGTSILCLHHDTLAVEKRFERHQEAVLIIAADNISERGSGRFVVSYDSSQTAIVWDIFTGDEISRFVSYEALRVASWMGNGNVAFGNAIGSIVLFDPSTSEHISARTIFDPITALAPAADCRTFAIGYSNGSILIASLQPNFTILHTLTTSRAPSPIVTLAWHASSSKQKTEMLATQTLDGDARVWSVAKYPSNETPRVVRVLKRSEAYEAGPNWLAWAKNGRVIQYSEGTTCSWDVRTKHITFEPIPTSQVIHGIAVHGPTSSLFTLGANHTIQQFDLTSPALVANIQHVPVKPPPSPPLSEQSQSGAVASSITSGSHTNSRLESESEEEAMPPLAKIANEMDHFEQLRTERSRALSPTTSMAKTRTNSMASSMASNNRYRSHHGSVASTSTKSSGTFFSQGSSLISSRETSSIGSPSASVTSSSIASRKSSRLRHEVTLSPEESRQDIFSWTRARLSDVPYRTPQALDPATATADELRQQMLSVVFGWDSDVEDLIRDELSHHKPGSASAVFLSKWLGDPGIDMMSPLAGSASMTSSDWMLLALSNIGGQASTNKLGQAYVQRLLEKRDIHAAATILLGLGDQNDAVEVYVSHKRYMEAVILSALVFPSDWQRLADLLRRWGESAVQHAEQQLAIRIFSCTRTEPSGAWTSPKTIDPPRLFTNISSVTNATSSLSPPISPPFSKGSSRIAAMNSSLKLITTFGDNKGSTSTTQSANEKTPMNNVGVTPIQDSALSPGAVGPWVKSAKTNTPASARTTTPGVYRAALNRLSAIGETPHDASPRQAGDKEETGHSRKSSDGKIQPPTLLLSSARYDPEKAKSPAVQTKMSSLQATLPSPGPQVLAQLTEKNLARNGSRDRKPNGLHIEWPPMGEVIMGEMISDGDLTGVPALPTGSSLSAMSPAPSEHSFASMRTGKSGKSSILSGRSLDKYASSVDEANYFSRHSRHKRRDSSRQRRIYQVSEDGSKRGRSRPRAKETSLDQNRTGVKYIKPAKRSPSSPRPMSPDDFPNAYAPENPEEDRYYGAMSPVSQPKTRDTSVQTVTFRARTDSKSSQVRYKPRSESQTRSRASSRGTTKFHDPQQKLEPLEVSERGRSKTREEGARYRSPSSPLPMSPQAALYFEEPETPAALKFVEMDRTVRVKTSDRPSRTRGTSTNSDSSPEKRVPRERSTSRRPQERARSRRRDGKGEHSPPLDMDQGPATGEIPLVRERSLRTIKKEHAARELAERRRSLARRPSAPVIPDPDDLSPSMRPSMTPRSLTDMTNSPLSWANPSYNPINRSKTVEPERSTLFNGGVSGTNTSSVMIGLPATPRAMRHPKYMTADPNDEDVPPVPSLSTEVLSNGENGQNDSSFKLPSTVYSPQHQQHGAEIKRSASVPVPSSPPPLPASMPTHPAFKHLVPPSNRQQNASPDLERGRSRVRNINPGSAGHNASTIMVSIDETLESSKRNFNPSNNDLVPPPPPPVPILPELQHLQAPPPPPPPPPAPTASNRESMSLSQVSGTTDSSGVINIGIIESRGTTPASVIEVPHQKEHIQRPATASSHHRGRSVNESFTSLFRGHRKHSTSRANIISPPVEHVAPPYESVRFPGMEIPVRPATAAPNYTGARHPLQVREQWNAEQLPGYVEGGMI